MRPVYGLLLTTIVSMSFLGMYLCTYVGLRFIHSEARERPGITRKQEDLTFLTLHKNDIVSMLKWEHQGEFIYKRKTYDVYVQVVLGDSVQFTLWWDEEETSLRHQLCSLAKNLMSDQPHQPCREKQILDFFKKLFIHKTHSSQPGEEAQDLAVFSEKTSHIYLLMMKPPSPPPWAYGLLTTY